MMPIWGFGGILTFAGDAAMVSMAKARKSFLGLHGSAQQFSIGMRQLSMGLPMLALGMAAVAAPLKLATDAGLGFEQAMSGVQSVLLVTHNKMGALTERALELSATTVFTARQVAEAMEIMARAGFTTNETIQITSGVLAAAAAEGIEMATAAEIIGGSVRTFGLNVSEANRVADIFALTSARSMTSIVEMGESFKYGASQAVMAGMSIEEFAAAVGLMGNRNLKASRAGTNMAAAMVQLTKPTERGIRVLRSMGLGLEDVSVGAKGFSTVMKNLFLGFEKFDTATEIGRRRLEAAFSELFGRRGARAMFAIMAAMKEDINAFDEFTEMLKDAEGTAEAMAMIRLDNVLGKITLIKSALEVIAIEGTKSFLPRLKSGFQGLADQINTVNFAMQALRAQETGQLVTPRGQQIPVQAFMGMKVHREQKVREKFGLPPGQFMEQNKAIEIASGIRDAINIIHAAIDSLLATIRKHTSKGSIFHKLFGDEDSLRSTTRAVTLFLTFGALVTPLALGMASLGFAVQGLVWSVGGLFRVLSLVVVPFKLIGTIIKSVGLSLAQKVVPAAAAGKIGFLGMAKAIGQALLRFSGIGLAIGTVATVLVKAASMMGLFSKETLSVAKGGAVGFFKEMWVVIKAIGSALSYVFGVFDSITTILAKTVGVPFLQAILDIGGAVVDALSVAWGIIKPLVVGIAQIFSQPGQDSSFMKNYLAGWEKVWSVVGSFITFIGKIIEWTIRADAAIASLAVAAFSFIKQSIGKLFKSGYNAVSSFFSRATAITKSVFGKIMEFGDAVWEYFKNQAKEKINNVLEVFGTDFDALATRIKAGFRAAFDIKGIIADTARAGAQLLVTLADKVPAFAKSLKLDDPVNMEKLRAFAEDRAPLLVEEKVDMPDPKEVARTKAKTEATRESGLLDKANAILEKAMNPEINIYSETAVNLDGEEIARNQAKHQIDLTERAGADIQPWQRRAIDLRGFHGGVAAAGRVM